MVGSILKITVDDVNEVRALENKRAADMMPYIAICYITFGVFLLILLVLYNTFIPMMSEASEKVGGGGWGRGRDGNGNGGFCEDEDDFIPLRNNPGLLLWFYGRQVRNG